MWGILDREAKVSRKGMLQGEERRNTKWKIEGRGRSRWISGTVMLWGTGSKVNLFLNIWRAVQHCKGTYKRHGPHWQHPYSAIYIHYYFFNKLSWRPPQFAAHLTYVQTLNSTTAKSVQNQLQRCKMGDAINIRIQKLPQHPALLDSNITLISVPNFSIKVVFTV